MVVKCTAVYVISNLRPHAGRRLAPLYLGWCRCPLSQLSDQSDDTGSAGNLPLPPPPTWLPLWSTCRPPQRWGRHLRETDTQTDVQAVGKKYFFFFFLSINQSPAILMNDGPVRSIMTFVYSRYLNLFWDCYGLILELKELPVR